MLKLRRLFTEIVRVLEEDEGISYLKDLGDKLDNDEVLVGTNTEGYSVVITEIEDGCYTYYYTDTCTGITARYESGIGKFKGYSFKKVNVGTYDDFEKRIKVRKDLSESGDVLNHNVFVYGFDSKLKLARQVTGTDNLDEAEQWLVGKSQDEVVTAYVKSLFADIARCIVVDVVFVSSMVNYKGKEIRSYGVKYTRTPDTDENSLNMVKNMVEYIR